MNASLSEFSGGEEEWQEEQEGEKQKEGGASVSNHPQTGGLSEGCCG